MTHNGLNRAGIELGGPTAHLGVAKAVEREARLPRLRSSATQHVPVGSSRLSERTNAELAALEDLGRLLASLPRQPGKVTRREAAGRMGASMEHKG